MESVSPGYDDVGAASVGAGDSVVSAETASVGAVASVAGLVAGTAVTVTEDGRRAAAEVEVGRRGATP